MNFLQQLHTNLMVNVTIIIAGLAGGTVALIRAARAKRKPISFPAILGSLFIAAFTSWMVALILPEDLSPNIRTVICGIAGMSGDKLLVLIDAKLLRNGADFIKRL